MIVSVSCSRLKLKRRSEQLKRSHIHQKKQYDRKAKNKEWEIGRAVWLFNPTKQVGKSPKLTIFWEEQPYVIIEQVNDVVVKIQKNARSKPKIVHVDRLKLVEGHSDTSWFTGKDQNPKTPTAAPPRDGKASLTVLEQMGLSTC